MPVPMWCDGFLILRNISQFSYIKEEWREEPKCQHAVTVLKEVNPYCMKLHAIEKIGGLTSDIPLLRMTSKKKLIPEIHEIYIKGLVVKLWSVFSSLEKEE